MTKKIKFPLKINGEDIRTLEDLRTNFDIEALVGYFSDGRLQKWLEDRHYNNEAEKISTLDKDNDNLALELYEIFKVEPPAELKVDVEEIARRRERINKLRQYTADKNILSQVDSVAFNQAELDALIVKDVEKIYLCADKFKIPLNKKNKSYVGIGKAVAIISSNEPVNFATLNISFANIRKEFFSEGSDNQAAASVIVNNKDGIKSEQTAFLVEAANKFKSQIQLRLDDKVCDAKDGAAVLEMNIPMNAEIIVVAKGVDAKNAVERLVTLIHSDFKSKPKSKGIFSRLFNFD